MATEVGVGYVSIVPETAGFKDALSTALERIGGKVGEESGEKTGNSLAKAAGKAVKAAGVAVGAGLVASVVEGAKREQGSDKLAASLGLSPEESKRVASVSADIYKGAWGESTEQVNEALRGVMQQVDGMASATDEDLKRVTTGVLDVATAFDQDLGATSAAVGQMIKTGMAKDAVEALDLITVGFQSGVDKQGDFLDTITEYGTQFRKLGIEGPAAVGLLSQGLAAGARDADKVADAIKEFSIRAVDGSKATVGAFQDLGLNFNEMERTFAQGGPEAAAALDMVLGKLRGMEDPAQRAQVATALFGTQAEDLGDALYALDLGTAQAGMEGVAGASQAMSDTLNDNAATQIEGYKRSIQDMGLATVEALGPMGAMAAAALSFAPAIADTVGPIIAATAARRAATAATVADTAATKTNVVSLVAQRVAMVASAVAMGVVKAATIAWTAVQWLLNVALSANPIGLIVIAIAALIGAVIYAWNNFDWFRNAVLAVWEAIKTYVVTYITVIKTVVLAVWEAIKTVGLVIWNAIKAYVTTYIAIIRKVIEVAMKVIGWVWENVFVRMGDIVKNVFGFVRNIIENVVGWIQSAFDFIKGIVDKIMVVVGPVIDFISTGVSAVGDVLGFANGGMVPGSGNTDSVPARLTPGEFVLNKDAVRAIGPHRLAAMNAGQSTGGGVVVETLVVNNPRPEPASDSLPRSIRKVAYLGAGF